jgi:hypothetical protein
MISPLEPEYLRECFDLVDGVFYWKERPIEHFKDSTICKTFNARMAGKKAGSKNGQGTVCIRLNNRQLTQAQLMKIWNSYPSEITNPKA